MHFLCYHVAETFLIMLIKNLINLIEVILFMVNEEADDFVSIIGEVKRKARFV